MLQSKAHPWGYESHGKLSSGPLHRHACLTEEIRRDTQKMRKASDIGAGDKE